MSIKYFVILNFEILYAHCSLTHQMLTTLADNDLYLFKYFEYGLNKKAQQINLSLD